MHVSAVQLVKGSGESVMHASCGGRTLSLVPQFTAVLLLNAFYKVLMPFSDSTVPKPRLHAAGLAKVRDGKMHNFLRMYWAKKILEWTPSPHDALER